MNWQEIVVAVVVSLAVVSLVRHLRGLFAETAPGSQSSCHGCSSCLDDKTESQAKRGAPVGLSAQRTH